MLINYKNLCSTLISPQMSTLEYLTASFHLHLYLFVHLKNNKTKAVLLLPLRIFFPIPVFLILGKAPPCTQCFLSLPHPSHQEGLLALTAKWSLSHLLSVPGCYHLGPCRPRLLPGWLQWPSDCSLSLSPCAPLDKPEVLFKGKSQPSDNFPFPLE